MTHPPLRRRRLAASLLAASALTVTAAPAAAVPLAEGVAAPVHLRTRLDRHQGRDGNDDNPNVTYIEHRTRLGLSVKHESGVGAFLQLQDVRVFGEELDTLNDFSGEGLDMHQAYLDAPVFGPLSLRVGRQEMAYDEQRLIGAVGWTPQGRSFDALRLRATEKDAPWLVDAFFAVTADTESLTPLDPIPSPAESAIFTGLVGQLKLAPSETHQHALSLYALLDDASRADRTRYTVGLYDRMTFGPAFARLEGYYQGGSNGDADISAFLLGAAAGVTLDVAWKPTLTLWADYLSGDDDPTDADIGTFDTLFATNHAFYGFADFFMAIPAHTQNKGLVDLAVKLAASPTQTSKVGLDLHRFLAAEPRGGAAAFGTETDLYASWRPVAPLELFFGAFLMLPDDALEARLGGDDADLGLYLSAQLDL